MLKNVCIVDYVHEEIMGKKSGGLRIAEGKYGEYTQQNNDIVRIFINSCISFPSIRKREEGHQATGWKCSDEKPAISAIHINY